jgi:hypothetical protein
MSNIREIQSNNPNLRLSVADSFNLFRRKEAPELFCAVPEDRAVPRFIAGESWEFGGRISGDSHFQPGFDRSAARSATGMNGFYLFQTWKPCEKVAETAA